MRCLFLTAVDAQQRAVLQKPIWEIVTPGSKDEDLAAIDELLVASRHAIRSAMAGADQMDADFGMDIRQYMVASYLPHNECMKELGRLIALHAMQRQSAGDWKGAADVLAAGLRMGRHMTHQTTLAESLAGVEILESMYFALGQWAVRCPDTELVDDVSDLVNAMATDMVNPARSMRFEASISKMRLDALESAFPDGPWAEMVLEALGAEIPSGGPEAMKQAAIDAATSHGLPRDAFNDRETLDQYLRKMRSVYAELARESAECLTLRPPHSIRQGQEVYARYATKLPDTERRSTKQYVLCHLLVRFWYFFHRCPAVRRPPGGEPVARAPPRPGQVVRIAAGHRAHGPRAEHAGRVVGQGLVQVDVEGQPGAVVADAGQAIGGDTMALCRCASAGSCQ